MVFGFGTDVNKRLWLKGLGLFGDWKKFFFFLVKGRKKFNLLKVFDNSHRDM